LLFYAPLVGVPFSPAPKKLTDDKEVLKVQSPKENMLAFGSVRPWISLDFGKTWKAIPSQSLNLNFRDEKSHNSDRDKLGCYTNSNICIF
jgi:hypothetical protein